jgi:hypothetical protein
MLVTVPPVACVCQPCVRLSPSAVKGNSTLVLTDAALSEMIKQFSDGSIFPGRKATGTS